MKLSFVSKRGKVLSLTDNDLFFLTNVDGQTAAASSISSVVTGGIDGDTVTNVQAQPRTIILALRKKSGVDVEYAKREILSIIKLKQYGSLIWEQNERTVTISGIVESIDMPRWNNKVMMQISLYCEQPFWEDIAEAIQEISSIINLHYFTSYPYEMLYFPENGIAFGRYDTSKAKSFTNNGDVSVGMEIIITAIGKVTNPIIYDTDGNFFGVGYGSGDKQVIMGSGDKIVISTYKGNKTVKLNGVSMYDKIKPQSTWLQLQAGENQFRVDSDESALDNLTFQLEYKQLYI